MVYVTYKAETRLSNNLIFVDSLIVTKRKKCLMTSTTFNYHIPVFF